MTSANLVSNTVLLFQRSKTVHCDLQMYNKYFVLYYKVNVTELWCCLTICAIVIAVKHRTADIAETGGGPDWAVGPSRPGRAKQHNNATMRRMLIITIITTQSLVCVCVLY